MARPSTIASKTRPSRSTGVSPRRAAPSKVSAARASATRLGGARTVAPAPASSSSVDGERQIRGERLVEKVLEATLEELSLVGYGNLSMETVAERAGVNKTTIYRRWPTKADLAGAALCKEASGTVCVPDTGSIRSDMVAMLQEFRDLLRTRRGQSLFRMFFAEGLSPEVAGIVEKLREEKEKEPKAAVARAVARGELPAGTDVDLLFTTLTGSLQSLIFFCAEVPNDARIEQIVDLVLGGACAASATTGPPRAPRLRCAT